MLHLHIGYVYGFLYLSVFHLHFVQTSVVDLWSGGNGDLWHRAAHIQLSQSQLIHKVRQL